MTTQTENFKSELKALMEKYDVIFDISTSASGSVVEFYSDTCSEGVVTLTSSPDVEFMEKAADCIK